MLHLVLSFISSLFSSLLTSLSFCDSRASNTAAPTKRYVKVQTIRDKVRTFCFFIASQPCPRERQNFQWVMSRRTSLLTPSFFKTLTRTPGRVSQWPRQEKHNNDIPADTQWYIEYVDTGGEKIMGLPYEGYLIYNHTFHALYLVVLAFLWNVRWNSNTLIFCKLVPFKEKGNVEVDVIRKWLVMTLYWNVAKTTALRQNYPFYADLFYTPCGKNKLL
jgi:hypothetical protein